MPEDQPTQVDVIWLTDEEIMKITEALLSYGGAGELLDKFDHLRGRDT